MSPDPVRLPFLEVSGAPYDIGHALGRFGARAVHEHLTATPAWRELMPRAGDERIPRMATAVRSQFPCYWAELHGLADGLGLPFDEVFLWNCRGDIRSMAPDGCTTVQFPGAPPGASHLIGHNEDGDPGFAGHCALARIASEAGTAFTAFVYPGSLPGHAFAVTAAGLVQTVNNVRALDGGAGVPRMILTRAVLDARDLDGALALLRSADRAGAFHLTLAQAGDDRLLSVEFTATRLSVRRIRTPGVHANHLIHADMDRVSQIVTGSSGQRQARGNKLIGQMRQAAGEPDALRVLWDADDPELPIHRTDPADPDVENTLATAIFGVTADKVEWSVYDVPRQPARFVMGGGLVPAAA
ncbi:C45 family autoproteolytic acyltransferase/hydolase [Rhodospirillaceae bacterium SYSU D60014]|uniref:C45 family autoproteolytic acyltransferase/hydolase n=1 Tax=Virgifigura deserti TaxID=2268457 RepID=UPI000E663836